MKFSFRFQMTQLFFATVLVVSCSGCGGGASDQPSTGEVSGMVSLDGTAVANAQVSFKPEEGRPSSGVTDENGKYQLIYNSTTMGAKVGKHRVAISTVAVSEEDEPTETMPESVADGTTLTAEVKGGSNVIDFKLEAKDY